MKCRRAKPLLSRYADGELSAGEARGVREHLIACPRCRGIVSEIASVRRFFDDAGGDARRAPAGFADRAAAAAFAASGEASAPASAVAFARRIAAVAAGVALLAGGGILARLGAFDRGPSSLQAQEEDPVVQRIRDRFEPERAELPIGAGARPGGTARDRR
ncbi:MAG TPA: zf-HC2 domain-containing protein [Planctomycetota bacterium]|nr:zf-HC2 domain-containing protein [Planctomycetota bacterium]